jgi:hypothetical protein
MEICADQFTPRKRKAIKVKEQMDERYLWRNKRNTAKLGGYKSPLKPVLELVPLAMIPAPTQSPAPAPHLTRRSWKGSPQAFFRYILVMCQLSSWKRISMIIRLLSYVIASPAGWVLLLLCLGTAKSKNACYFLYRPTCWSINNMLSCWNVCTFVEPGDQLMLIMILWCFIYLWCDTSSFFSSYTYVSPTSFCWFTSFCCCDTPASMKSPEIAYSTNP